MINWLNVSEKFKSEILESGIFSVLGLTISGIFLSRIYNVMTRIQLATPDKACLELISLSGGVVLWWRQIMTL